MIIKSRKAKLFAGVAGVAVALSISFGAAVAPASAVTIDELMAQIVALTAQLNQLKGTSGSSMTTGSLTSDLSMGMTSDQVKTLQMILNKSADTQVSSSGAGSPGNETMYFGAKTKAAVMKFQSKNGITPVAGYVGPKTRAALNAMGGVVTPGTTPGTTPSGSGLSVMAAAQPSASLAPQGTSRIPFTKVTLTASNDGDITVNGITVERGGLAQDSVFSGLVLLDEDGTQIGIAKTLNSNHQATVGSPFVVKAGTSKTVTIGGNMAASLALYAGQVAALSVVGVNTSATVNGSFPITGAGHTINATLTIGTAVVGSSSFDPAGAQSKEIGTTGYKFSGVRITAGSAEKVRLWSIRFNQIGSASSNDLTNIKVNVDGTNYDAKVSSDGKYYTANFGTGIVIDKGVGKDVYIQADIIGSSSAGRTVQFDLYKTTDIYLTGETYSYGITPTANALCATTATTGSQFIYSSASCAGTASTPWFDGSLVTVTAGAVTSVAKANSVAAQNIAVNVPNQVLGGYSTNFRGEAVSVQSSIFAIATTSGFTGASGVITNIAIYDENGAIVAGPVDEDADATNGETITFTDTITYPVGTHTYTLKGKIPSGVTGGATVIVSTTPSSQWTSVTGQTTGNSVSLSTLSTAVTMNTMTVKAANLAVSVSATPAIANIVAGSPEVLFANYQFDASQSGEDLRFSSLTLNLTGATAAATTTLTSCQLYDGSTALNTGGNVVNPSGSPAAGAFTFTLDQSLTISKPTVKTLALKCNLSSAATTQTYAWGIGASATLPTVTGVTSGTSLTAGTNLNSTAAAGQLMTVANGSLAVSTDSSSPSYAVVAANTTGVVIAAYKFRATNESVNLNRVGLKLTNTASSSASDLVQVGIYDGSTRVGTATFVGANTNATSSLDTTVVLPKDTDKVLTIKADFASIGTGQPAVSGHLIAIDIDPNTNTQGTGVGSGTTISATGSTSASGARLFKSYPVFTYTATGGSGALTNGVVDLLTLTVAANSGGEVQLNKISFTLSTTTVTLTAPTFYGPNGNVASTTNVNFSGFSAGIPSTIVAFFDSASNNQDRVVPAGSSKSYTLRGTVSGLTGSNSGTVSLALKADTSFPALAASTFMTATSTLNTANMIWSPSSTSTQSVSGSNDWTNGYGLGGCFSTSGLGNDCTARVISNN